MDVPVLADQQEFTNNSSVQTQEDLPGAMDDSDEWRESGKSVLAV